MQEQLNAFTVIDHAGAMAAAKAVDAGQVIGPLAGVPVVIKDMTPTFGLPTTRGSWTTGEGRTDDPDAVIVARLRAAGAIVVAKSTTPEFAYSSFTQSPRYGITRNPWDPARTPGGSSGGSAVAVACRVAPFAEGSDMGGSIRIPAAACGIVGFKPSLGRIPMTVLPTPIDMISHFGPLAATVADAVAFLAATAGAHDLDLLSQTTPFSVPSCAPASLAGVRFAVSVDLGYFDVAPAVEAALMAAVEVLRDAGASVTEVRLPWTREVLNQWTLKWAALLAMFPSGERMDPALLALVASAVRTTALDLKETERVQARMASDMAAIFVEYDALICPTLAVAPPDVEAKDTDFEVVLPNGKLRGFDMTHPFNMLAPYPVITLPAGWAEGMPMGLQLVGPRFGDERTLALAGGVEALIGRWPAASLGA